MFALAIYAELTNDRHPASDARSPGTGTIAADGTVGPIEGTQQKLIAAKRAGARCFLVPRKTTRGRREPAASPSLPVSTFSEALAAHSVARGAALDGRRLNVVGEGFEPFAVERAHAAAIQFDGARILQAQQCAGGHVADGAGGRGNLRLREIFDAGEALGHARGGGRVREQELCDPLQARARTRGRRSCRSNGGALATRR
jgi:hypothetical protein